MPDKDVPAPPNVGLLDPLSQGTRAAELTGDGAFLQAMVDVELALAGSLIGAGVVPVWMGGVCDGLSDARSLDLAAIAHEGRSGGNPVIPLVKHLGVAAEKLHPGASDHLHIGATSQDILDSAAMVIAGRVIDEVTAQLETAARNFASLADTHRSTPIVGRTLGQQASPTTFGFVVAGWLDGVLTAREKLAQTRLPLQLGGAVGELSVLRETVQARMPSASVESIIGEMAARLGLSTPPMSWHTNRVAIAELAASLAIAAGAVGSFATDVSVLSRTEIAELSERLGAGEGGSSAMPHKRNPVTAVLIAAAARQTPALASTLFSSMLAEDQRPSGAWHSEWLALRSLESHTIAAATGAASLSGRLEVHADRMLANLDITGGLVYSERVTTMLAESLGKRRAFELVEKASRESFDTNRPLQIVLSGVLATGEHDDELRQKIWSAFDLGTSRGQSGASIDRVLARFRAPISTPATRASVT